MKKLVSILLLAVFATQCTNSVSLRRRREAAVENKQDTGVIAMMQSGVLMAESFPIVGGCIKSGITWMSKTYNALEDLTNGGITRTLGGKLPCEMSMKNGVQCTGVTDETNAASLIMGVAAELPLPDFVQKIMKALLDGTLDPIMNTMFGGVRTPGSQ